jgi:2-polyprenyl-3-methyl-5-hydroxy-6-metoxy-1,4-benzoquinol methylase
MDVQQPLQPPDRVFSYRERLYERYATNWQEGSQKVNSRRLRAHAKAYRYYFRGWLPGYADASIVDVGCGRGLLLTFFEACGYKNVQGIDISPEQVELAQSIGVKVREGDAIAYLDAQPGMFDLLTGLDVLEHFHKPEVIRFLEAAHKALKPGGRLVLQTPNAESFWGSMHRYNDFTHEVGFNPNSLSRLLRLVGFATVEAREIGPVPWRYSMVSTLRFVAWQVIRMGLKCWNLAETGDAGSGIFTRVFLISASRR